MTHIGNARELIEKAQAVVGDDPVLAAGVFGSEELVASQVAGGSTGRARQSG